MANKMMVNVELRALLTMIVTMVTIIISVLTVYYVGKEIVCFNGEFREDLVYTSDKTYWLTLGTFWALDALFIFSFTCWGLYEEKKEKSRSRIYQILTCILTVTLFILTLATVVFLLELKQEIPLRWDILRYASVVNMLIITVFMRDKQL
ncbi:amino acid transporter [Rahnella inusitata]|nr:amino acid transporter [Rahnella inusitata]